MAAAPAASAAPRTSSAAPAGFLIPDNAPYRKIHQNHYYSQYYNRSHKKPPYHLKSYQCTVSLIFNTSQGSNDQINASFLYIVCQYYWHNTFT